MKFRDNKIYQNKPNRDRKYLLKQQNDSHRDKEAYNRYEIRHTLDRIQRVPFIMITKQKKSPEKQSLAQRAKRYRREIISERHSVTERSSDTSILSKPKRTSYQISQQKAYHHQPSKKILRILTTEDKESTMSNQNKRLPLRLSHIIEPLLTSNRRNMKPQINIPDDFSDKRAPKCKLTQRDSQSVLNFTPKHKSLSKISLQAFNMRKLQKKDFMKGYIREDKLGKGGFSQVWSALQIKTGKRFAVKQMNITNKYQTHLAEIAFSTYFFENGQPKSKFISHPGIDVLLLMNSCSIQNQKAYVMYEKCDGALGQFLFQIFQQTARVEEDSQKKYFIMHKPLYQLMRRNTFFFKSFIFQMAQALDLLQSCNIVHSDVKTSNILLKMNPKSRNFDFKLIDYGSSFFFAHLEQYKLATPQYMPPQLLNYLNYRSGKSYDNILLEYTKGYTNISAIDMWGLGCIFLQILHGIPVWLNNLVKMQKQGKVTSKYGVFATKGRAYNQILQKQLSLTQNIEHFLQAQNNTQIALDDTLILIFKGMLTINPANRIRPKKVIELLSCQDFQ